MLVGIAAPPLTRKPVATNRLGGTSGGAEDLPNLFVPGPSRIDDPGSAAQQPSDSAGEYWTLPGTFPHIGGKPSEAGSSGLFGGVHRRIGVTN